MAMPCVRCGAYTVSYGIVPRGLAANSLRPLCDICGGGGLAKNAARIPPQAETDSMRIAQAIVNHATTPLVSPERRKELEVFVRTIRIVEDAFGFKLGGDSDCSKDILILDTRRQIPQGYYYDARIMPSGELEVAEWVLDDETEATKQ